MFGFSVSVLIGVSLGFGFGVGCALAVMYSIFMGGYRAALQDARMEPAPKRYVQQMARLNMAQSHDS